MKFTLVIPAHNEAPVIQATTLLLARTFRAKGVRDWNILVVDNDSSDHTALYVSALNHERISVLTLPEKGKGRAVRAAFKGLTSDVVGFTDADLSVPPEEVVDAFLKVAEGDVGILIGSRLHPESIMPGREWWRTGSSKIFNILARVIVGIQVSDTQCPLKVMDRNGHRVMLATCEPTWFFDLEFVAYAERLGLPLETIPVTWNEHRYPLRKSKLSTTRDGMRAVLAMMRIRKNLPSQLALLRKHPSHGG